MARWPTNGQHAQQPGAPGGPAAWVHSVRKVTFFTTLLCSMMVHGWSVEIKSVTAHSERVAVCELQASKLARHRSAVFYKHKHQCSNEYGACRYSLLHVCHIVGAVGHV